MKTKCTQRSYKKIFMIISIIYIHKYGMHIEDKLVLNHILKRKIGCMANNHYHKHFQNNSMFQYSTKC